MENHKKNYPFIKQIIPVPEGKKILLYDREERKYINFDKRDGWTSFLALVEDRDEGCIDGIFTYVAAYAFDCSSYGEIENKFIIVPKNYPDEQTDR